MRNITLLLLITLVSCSTAKKLVTSEPDPSKPRKIGSLVFYTGTKNPFLTKRNKNSLDITYKIRVQNLSREEKKLDLSYSSLFVDDNKIATECFDYKRNQLLKILKGKTTTIFCLFKLTKPEPVSKEGVKKSKVKVLLSVDGLESYRFSYNVKLESDFL